MHWLFLALLTAFFYGLYNVFIKISSGHIHEIVWAVILQLVAALLWVALLAYMYFSGEQFEITQKWIHYAIYAWLFVGLAEITSFYLFSKWISVSVWVPIIVAGSIVVAALLWLLFLKEYLSLTQVFWVVLIVWGTVLLAR